MNYYSIVNFSTLSIVGYCVGSSSEDVCKRFGFGEDGKVLKTKKINGETLFFRLMTREEGSNKINMNFIETKKILKKISAKIYSV
ncbi:hypothetical protein KKH36_02160 [Patescibacteria group bacterium]|nr:hypothetical protein [Patescibacteria group bacterium]